MQMVGTQAGERTWYRNILQEKEQKTSGGTEGRKKNQGQEKGLKAGGRNRREKKEQ